MQTHDPMTLARDAEGLAFLWRPIPIERIAEFVDEPLNAVLEVEPLS